MSLEVSWYPIQDGVSTIIRFEVSGEFVVASGDGVQREAEAVMVKLVSRVADCPEDEVRGAIDVSRWLGDIPRPPEPV